MQNLTTVRYTDTLPEKSRYFKLFETTGWNLDYQLDEDRLYEAIRHSWYVVSAYHDDLLIGFGRAISDGVLHALIVDLTVHPNYQGRGTGSHILNALVEKCRSSDIRDIQLFCAKGKVSFYEKNGFVPRPTNAPGMEIKLENVEACRECADWYSHS